MAKVLDIPKFRTFKGVADIETLNELLINTSTAVDKKIKDGEQFDIRDYLPRVRKPILVSGILATLELLKVYWGKSTNEYKVAYPFGIDKLLLTLYQSDKSTYKKLNTFENGRYSAILKRNSFFNKNEFVRSYNGKKDLDDCQLFYGAIFVYELPEIWKYHGIKPIVIPEKLIDEFAGNPTYRVDAVVLDKIKRVFSK